MWKWPQFTEEQIRCADGTIIVNEQALDALERLFTIFGKCRINSAYRSPEYNIKVGGAKNSMHLQGRAFDLAVGLLRQLQLQECAKTAGFTGFGHYKTFLHCDTGPKREWWIGVTRKDLQ